MANEQTGHDSEPLSVLLDMELPVLLRFASTRMPLRDVARLARGSTIAFDSKCSEDAVELVVNGCVVAKGEAVVVQGCYGIRIVEVLSRGRAATQPPSSEQESQ